MAGDVIRLHDPVAAEIAKTGAVAQYLRQQPTTPPEPVPGTDYAISSGSIYWLKPGSKERPDIYVPLAGFVPEAPRLLTLDDGAEVTRSWRFSGRAADGRKLPTIEVPAAEFAGMGWVPRLWPKARIYPGQATKDRLRDALTCIFQDAPEETIFVHAGWREIDGKWVYLLPGAALPEGMECRLDDKAFHRYWLPAPPTGAALADAVQASLDFLRVADKSITWPLWAAVYRAPTASLLWPTVMLWLFGLTGSLKSTLSGLVLCHYGDFAGDTLPGSWLSTDNALEGQLFAAKDLLYVIDDYAPEKYRHKAQELDARVNRIVRQVGNHTSRARRRADLSAAPDRAPRAMVISTGEQLPLGIGSVAARILPVEVSRDKVDMEALTFAQRETAARYPEAMAGYISWLAPQIPALQRTLPEEFRELRDGLRIGGHLRLAESVAHILLGARLGLRFAQEVGAVSAEQAQDYEAECQAVLVAHAEAHSRRMTEERPVALYLRIIAELLAQGKAYLADRATGAYPKDGQRWGWPPPGEAPRGELLGWVDDDGVYLLPEAAYKAVCGVAQAGGGFPVTESTLRTQLLREGVLIPGEGGRTTANVRVGTDGTKRVLRLRVEALDI